MSAFAVTPLFLVVVLVTFSFCIGWACGRIIGYSAGYAEGERRLAMHEGPCCAECRAQHEYEDLWNEATGCCCRAPVPGSFHKTN